MKVSPLIIVGVLGLGFVAGWLARAPMRPQSSTRTAQAREGSHSADAGEPRLKEVAPNRTERTPHDRVRAAWRAVHRTPGRATRLYDFALRLSELEPAQYPELLQVLRTARTPETPEMLAMLCSVWAGYDGPAAFAAGQALVARDGEFDALHGAVSGWARADPAAAFAAMREARLTDLSSDAMAAFLQGWGSVQPAAAEAFLSSAVGGESDDDGVPAAMQRGYEAIASARLDADPDAAMEWYKRLRAPLQERLREAVLMKLAATDPQRANDWLGQDAAAQVGASEVLPLMRGLRLEGYEQQFAWANGLANSVTRESAMIAVVNDAASTNLVSLGEWLAARADDAALTPAFSAYALQVVKKSPTAAVTWAMSLDQPELRQTALNTVAAEWMTINPRAAREWAQRTKLVDWEAIVR